MKVALLFILALPALAFAGGQSSANYTIQSGTLDGGGSHATSANYYNDASVGSFSGAVTANATGMTNRNGYIGQLYEVTGLALTAPATNLNEGATMPMQAVQSLDDGTVTTANSFAQWSCTPPLAGVSPSGVVTAATVEQNSPAMVQAAADGKTASMNLMVLNVVPNFNLINWQPLGVGLMRLSYVGNAGTQYALERTYNLLSPVIWVPQITNLSDINGSVVFTNLANPTTNNFWRIHSVP